MVTAIGQPWTVNTTTVTYRTRWARCSPRFMDAGYAKGPLGMTGTTLDVTAMGMGGSVQLVSRHADHLCRLRLDQQPERPDLPAHDQLRARARSAAAARRRGDRRRAARPRAHAALIQLYAPGRGR